MGENPRPIGPISDEGQGCNRVPPIHREGRTLNCDLCSCKWYGQAARCRNDCHVRRPTVCADVMRTGCASHTVRPNMATSATHSNIFVIRGSLQHGTAKHCRWTRPRPAHATRMGGLAIG